MTGLTLMQRRHHHRDPRAVQDRHVCRPNHCLDHTRLSLSLAYCLPMARGGAFPDRLPDKRDSPMI